MCGVRTPGATGQRITLSLRVQVGEPGLAQARRLIAERRIRFVRVGRHVRIPESALREFIAAGLVEPITPRTRRTA